MFHQRVWMRMHVCMRDGETGCDPAVGFLVVYSSTSTTEDVLCTETLGVEDSAAAWPSARPTCCPLPPPPPAGPPARLPARPPARPLASPVSQPEAQRGTDGQTGGQAHASCQVRERGGRFVHVQDAARKEGGEPAEEGV